MPVKMNPTSVIKARLGITPDGRVQKFFTSTCAKKMDRYVPYREGLLSEYHIYGTEIWYEQPYARYQYHGQREDGSHKVHNYTTPGTGPYWDKVMWTAHGEDIIKQTQKLVNKG